MKKLLLTIVCFAAVNAHAMTTRQLYDYCVIDSPVCDGYFVGYFDGIGEGKYFEYNGNNTVSVGTAENIFMKWSSNNPEWGDSEAGIGISMLLEKKGTLRKTEYYNKYLKNNPPK